MKKFASIMIFLFVFQVMSFAGFTQDISNEIQDVPAASVGTTIDGEINTMMNIPADANTGGVGGYLKKSLQEKKDKIIKKLMKQVESEGIPKVIKDLKTLGPIGEYCAVELEMCENKEQQMETLRDQMDMNIDLLFVRVGELKDDEVKSEMDKFSTKVKSQSNGNMEAITVPSIKINFPGYGKRSSLTEGAAGGGGYVSQGFDLGKRLLQVGVGGVVLALNSVKFIVEGLVPLATSLISIIGDAIKMTCNFFIDFFKLLF
ncbi:hypothetical protein KAJ27_15915 [bacterium]|nr:hypothetical protein [bacterium]